MIEMSPELKGLVDDLMDSYDDAVSTTPYIGKPVNSSKNFQSMIHALIQQVRNEVNSQPINPGSTAE